MPSFLCTTGICEALRSWYRGCDILSAAGRFTQSWNPSMWPSSGARGISSCMMPPPAVIHWMSPAPIAAGVADAVPVVDLARQHVRHRLDAAVRVPRKPGQVVVGVVRAEVVEEEEGVHVVEGRGGDAALEAYACALDHRLRSDDALHGAGLLAERRPSAPLDSLTAIHAALLGRGDRGVSLPRTGGAKTVDGSGGRAAGRRSRPAPLPEAGAGRGAPSGRAGPPPRR